ncbi:acyltransferase domain-containing protein [Streptomyces sp. QTS52]
MTRETGAGRPVAFLLPGQGSQHIRMAAGLHDWEPGFTEALDALFAALGADGRRLRDDWLAPRPGVDLDHVTRSQPLLFAIDYALAEMVRRWGAAPVALLGHSAGELAAGALAGVFTPEDAMGLMWDRARRLATLPPGGMLAVAASAAELRPYLYGDVVVGAVNAPRQTMLAGPAPQLADVTEKLRAAGLTCREVRATTAFHSPAVRSACGTEAYAGVRLQAPGTALWSAYAAARLTDAQATDPAFWANHPADPVLFWAALDDLLATGPLLLVETGPGQLLSGLARRHRRVRTGESAAVALLPAVPKGPDEDRRQLARAADLIRAEGLPLPGHVTPVTTPDHHVTDRTD